MTTTTREAETQAVRGEPTREIRVALVLYGGVSLAIYENGVTRAFHDLVCGKGGFEFLLRLLDAKAVVDVVAGTSAGGINGLLLAAALEGRADFAPVASLWCELGDFGALLRKEAHPGAESVLDGEGYYQRKLFGAFQSLLSGGEEGAARVDVDPGEIDVFITGTDVEGRPLEVRDHLGQRIAEKSHRTVFHIRHRPGRLRLASAAEVQEGRDETPEEQAVRAMTLASISRLTSSFPAAFPTFSLAQLDELPLEGQTMCRRRELAASVRKALTTLGVREGAHYVDGGVLDNKPFGPVLEAIFYRMPSRVVDRRLFYVEPDPGPELAAASSGGTSPTPLAVAVASLSSLPAYESILGDLSQLEGHNSRVRWLKQLRSHIECVIRERRQKSLDSADQVQRDAYCLARRESLAKSLVFAKEGPPAAGDPVPVELQGRFDEISSALKPLDRAGLNRWDLEFLLRKTFFLLYRAHAALEKEPANADLRALVTAIGRLIQALEILRNAVIRRRGAARESSVTGAEFLAELQRYLSTSGPCSAWARALARQAGEGPALAVRLLEPGAPFSDAGLRALREARDVTIEGTPAPTSVVEQLHATLTALSRPALGTELELFDDIDVHTFPAEYLTGIHELDEVEIVRISPADAQMGLSRGSLADKVAGDRLGHFSAFLRRDWRASDIAYGRLDGVCQIVCSLLDDRTLALLAKGGSWDARLREALAASGFDSHEQHSLARTIVRDNDPESMKKFREAYIGILHQRIAREELEAILAARAYQDTVWGLRDLPGGLKFSSGKPAIQNHAEKLGREEARAIAQQDETRARFRELALGGEAAFGPDGRVPLHVVGDYAGRAYQLLWSMLSGRGGTLLDRRAARFLLLHPIRALHIAVTLAQRPGGVGPLAIWGLCSALAGATVMAWASPSVGLSTRVILLAAFLALCSLVQWFTPPYWQTWRRKFAVAIPTVILVAFLGWWRAGDLASWLEATAKVLRGSGGATTEDRQE